MRALALYRHAPLPARLHTRLRAWTCPFEPLLARLPERGRLLEVGCGHGLFANEAALRHPELDVLGLDPHEDKIRCARATVGARANVRFECARLEANGDGGFDAVAVIDVLYLLPLGEWPAFLAGCFARLRPHGTLLLKGVDTVPRWKFRRAALQELLSVRLLGITRGAALSYPDRATVRGLLAQAGFWDVVVTDLSRGYATPHVLYEGVRP